MEHRFARPEALALLTFQLVETGVFLALSGLLSWLCARLLRRRAA